MWILPACAVLCLGVCLPLFLHYKPLRPSLAASFKFLGTLCALIPALVASLRLDPLYWIFVAALALHAAADYLIEFSLEAGAGLFLLGHICYIIGFLKLYPLTPAHGILLLGFLSFLGYLFYRHRRLIGNHLLPFSVYGAALCIMAAGGIAGGASIYGWKGILTAIGAALFFFSDCLIFRRLLFPERARHDILIMVTYYLAQLLLSASCLLF